ncbi:MAG: D-alanine--D-serine ligase VanG [Oscillospiraceae bacterium]|jgi:D-alanine---D-serine ligase|nr:D-alanine--D-serine ligase VanG [Oscillospiraceae bacterium]
MDKITVAVLFGGYSSEYDISLISAASVIRSLDRKKYDVIRLGITREGVWLKFDGDDARIEDDTWWRAETCAPAIISPDRRTRGIVTLVGGAVNVIPVDVAFPVLHGKNGEDGTVQGLLALAGIPCVGSGTLSSALCMDKDVAHRLAAHGGIRVPNSITLRAPVTEGEALSRAAGLRRPLFVKPANAGSSFGVTKLCDDAELPAAIDAAFAHDGKVIVEEAIPGFEIGCAVLGDETLIVGEIDEIELSNGFFDFTEKYTLKTSKIHMPARLSAETAECVKSAARLIYRTLECSGMARVDMFLTPEGEIVFNEVNTIPGFTTHSRYPGMLGGVGLSFPEITDALIRLAIKRGGGARP